MPSLFSAKSSTKLLKRLRLHDLDELLRFSALGIFSEISCNGQTLFIPKALGACKARARNISTQD